MVLTRIFPLRPTLAQVRGMQQFLPLFEAIVPEGWRRVVAELIPAPPLKRLIYIADTLRRRSTEIFEAKKKALLAGDEALKQQVGEGRDLISVLRACLPLSWNMRRVTRTNADALCDIVKANMAASQEDKMPEDELIGQMTYVFPLLLGYNSAEPHSQDSDIRRHGHDFECALFDVMAPRPKP